MFRIEFIILFYFILNGLWIAVGDVFVFDFYPIEREELLYISRNLLVTRLHLKSNQIIYHPQSITNITYITYNNAPSLEKTPTVSLPTSTQRLLSFTSSSELTSKTPHSLIYHSLHCTTYKASRGSTQIQKLIRK